MNHEKIRLPNRAKNPNVALFQDFLCSILGPSQINRFENMPTIRRPRLLKAGVLNGMKPSSIAALLRPYAEYFQSRGIAIDQITEPRFDFTALVNVLAFSTELTPPGLVEQLEMLDLTSASQSTLNFETEYHEVVQKFREPDDSPADLAVKILLHAPEITLREFNRQALNADRSHVSFRVRPGMSTFEITPELISRFKDIVGAWFKDNARSEACIVHHLNEGTGDSFAIKHGEMLKRMSIFNAEGNEDSCIVRPGRIDGAMFNRFTGEWQVASLGLKVQELYRVALGLVFHGSKNALAYSNRYSLEPLRAGPDSLRCDISSMVQFAELKSLKLELPSGQPILIGRPPVFEALNHLNPGLLDTVPLLEATISLKLVNRRARVQLRICPNRDTIHGCTSDPAIDAWLVEHGFANDENRLLASA